MIDISGILKTEQIIQSVQESVKNGELKLNSRMPSIIQTARKFHVANETVVKAYNRLKELGIISSIRAKGFYITKTDFSVKRNIFVLFDAFTSYKETLYNSMFEELNARAVLDVYFHHFNFRTFESLIKEAAGKYTEYVILPFYDKRVKSVLKHIPEEQLYLIDCFLQDFPCRGVYQDFKNDPYNALSSVRFPGEKYRRFNFVYHGDCNYVVSGIMSGLKKYCEEQEVEFTCNDGINCPEIERGNAYLVLEDEHLVDLVLQARTAKLKPGTDVGIISYNDTALKMIAEGGVSVVSTDFAQMGRDISRLIIQEKKDCIINPVMFIDRGSY
jgi:DNA-binding transcriptional regulator YhcF (GntR family)